MNMAPGDDGGGDPPPAPPKAGDPPPAKPELKYTDDQVNAFKADAKKEAVAQLLKEAGVESTGKLKEDLAALKKIQDADKTEAQRLADDNKAKDEKLTAAETRALKAEAKAEALALGVSKEAVDDFVTIMTASETKDGETIAAKAARILEAKPIFKGAAPKPTIPQGMGGKIKNQGTPEAVAAAEAFGNALGLKTAKA